MILGYEFFAKNNTGLSATLNYGLSLARGEYIARIDSDDICFPERLELQHSFLQKKFRTMFFVDLMLMLLTLILAIFINSKSRVLIP